MSWTPPLPIPFAPSEGGSLVAIPMPSQMASEVGWTPSSRRPEIDESLGLTGGDARLFVSDAEANGGIHPELRALYRIRANAMGALAGSGTIVMHDETMPPGVVLFRSTPHPHYAASIKTIVCSLAKHPGWVPWNDGSVY